MRVLLINVTKGLNYISHLSSKNKFNTTTSAFTPPVGILYIASSLLEEGHLVKVIDYFCENNIEKTMDELLKTTDAVGLCVYTKYRFEAEKISKLIKDRYPNMPIIIGGPHCIYHPEKALVDIPSANFCVEGEGEYTIKYLIDSIENNNSFSDIHGIYYRENNKIKKGKPLKIIDDLDSISFPARHLVEKYDYGRLRKTYFYKPKFTTIMTSRGCPFHCRFCSRHVSTMKSYRKRSVKNVIDEFQIINSAYNSVLIVDDNFLCDKKWASKILDGIIELGIDLEIYIQGARVDTANKQLYLKMKKAGVKHIAYGLESGNQDVLDFYNKEITLEQIKYAVNLAHEMNFFIFGNFILGAPIETSNHLEKTINFACSLPIDIVIFQPLSYDYGSDLWYEAKENGKIEENEEYYYMADSKYNLSQFTDMELQEYCIKAQKKYIFRLEYLFREFVSSISRRDFRFLKSSIEFLI